MAPTLLEHDYIGLSGTQQPPPPPDGNDDDGDQGLLTGTELSLGMPGSANPHLLLLPLPPKKKDSISPVLTLGPPKGAKRGFADAIAGSLSDDAPKGGVAGAGNGVAKDGAATAAAAAATPMEKKGHAQAQATAAAGGADRGIAPAAKAQVVGWPPIRNYRKNTMAANPLKNNDDAEEKQDSSCLYVKVSMDGAPYLRKLDLKMCTNYKELSTALDKMFSCFTAGQCGSHGAPGKDGFTESRPSDLRGSELVVTYEDKDGDWMLVGDVPWEMFTDSCRRLRIMKGSDAIGLAPRAMEKCKNKN